MNGRGDDKAAERALRAVPDPPTEISVPDSDVNDYALFRETFERTEFVRVDRVVTPAFPEPEVDYGQRAQQAAEHALAALELNEFDGVPLPHDVTPSAPFCGCHTCVVREVLNAAWSSVLDAARDELRAAGWKEPT